MPTIGEGERKPRRRPRPRNDDEGSSGGSEQRSEGKTSRGRRRREPEKKVVEEDDDEEEEEEPRRRNEPKSGWDVESKTDDIPESKSKGRGHRQRGSRRMNNKHFDDNDDGDDAIMVIPVLEEEEEEAQLATVAEAPKVRSLRVQSMMELDQDIKYSLPTKHVDQHGQTVDLSLLAQVLSPQQSVMEEDVEWEFESLLQEVAQEITADLEAADLLKKEQDEGADLVTDRSKKGA